MASASAELLGRYEGAMSGQACLVTGAGSGIGRSVALAFARSGADVCVLGRRPGPLEDTAAMIEQAGRRALAIATDVEDPERVAAATTLAAESLGPIRVAVANAGVNAWADIQDLQPGVFRQALATNVEGVANLARAVIPQMVQASRGKLVIIASDNGRRAEAGGGGYVASKFAAVGLGLSLSRELIGRGVAVHIIEPGCVDTPWYADDVDAPRTRMLQPDDVALACLFVATLPPHILVEELMLLPRDLEPAG